MDEREPEITEDADLEVNIKAYDDARCIALQQKHAISPIDADLAALYGLTTEQFATADRISNELLASFMADVNADLRNNMKTVHLPKIRKMFRALYVTTPIRIAVASVLAGSSIYCGVQDRMPEMVQSGINQGIISAAGILAMTLTARYFIKRIDQF